ncbi:MAG: carbon monoxide dehydrogenase subunit G [Planctomycetes bacterium]|nr:carbon monoxide dehydrogenase subunit G [Planctomycetota bacterium]
MIEFKGSHIISRSRQELWPILQDPAVLKRCIPGCEELVLNGEHLYDVRLKVGFGMIKGSFQGTVQLTNMVEPERYVLNIKAEGRTGFAHGTTRIQLLPHPSPAATEIRFESHLQVGGMIASVGARLCQGAARMLAEQFFRELEKCLRN